MMLSFERPVAQTRWRRPFASAVAAVVLAASLTGCLRDKDITASVTDPAAPQDALHAQLESWSKRYSANPGEKTVSLGYARALATLDQKGQAASVLQTAAVKSPKDQEILAAYGKALVDTGDYNQAFEVLSRAHSPDQPDWRILSAQGIASDGMGLHDRAQSFYLSALKIAPGDPGVLSNLGLSYALSKKLPEAERVLTEAAQNPKADPRVRQNLALVLALQGRFDNATQALGHDLSPSDAAKNVADIRSMIAQPNTWDAIRGKSIAKDGAKGTSVMAVARATPAEPAAQASEAQAAAQ
jgi:Flp pilus assembly protein TadD